MSQYSKTSKAVRDAIWAGNIEELKNSISSGAKADMTDSSGNPILVVAARLNNMDLIKYLIEEVHLPVDMCSNSGTTPLMRAAYCGNLDMVKYLVSVGANLQLRDAVGDTALHCAATSHSLETLKFLQLSGVPIDSKGAYGRTVLHRAAQCSNPEFVKYLLEGGWLPVDCRDRNGQTPLMLAADFPRNEHDHCIYFDRKDRHNVNKVLKLLIAAGADPTAEDVFGRTALHRALGNQANFSYMLERCPNFVNCLDKKGQAAICIALKMYHGQYEMPFVVRKLLSAGANPNVQDEYGRTALSLAAKHRKFSVVEALVEFGVSLDSCEKHTLSEILCMAVIHGKLEIAQKMVAAGADVNWRLKSVKELPTKNGHTHQCLHQHWCDHTPSGRSAVFEALSRMEILKYLVAVGADVNLRDSDGCSPLNVAANYHKYECVELLLNAGADPLIADNCGVTPLHSAAGHFTNPKEFNNLIQLMKKKVGDNFEVNIKDHEWRTPLHYAANKGNIKGVELLISCGADLNAVDIHGETPAFMAVQHRGIIKLMTEAGADLSVKNKDDKTLLLRALEKGNINTVTYILKACKAEVYCKNPVSSTSLLHCATGNRKLEVLKYIMDKKFVPIDQKDGNGQTALSLACKFGLSYEETSAFQILLEAGANINIEDNNGKTILHHLAGQGSAQRVEMILATGVDITIKDNSGRIPLHYAAQTVSEKTVELLLKAAKEQQKSIIDEQDNEGKTPLMLAVCQSKIFSLLLKEGANINVQDSAAKTVLQIAIDNQYFAEMKLLLEMGADFSNIPQDSQIRAVHLSVKAGDIEVLNQLIGLGMDPLECWWDPEHKSTLIHHAARSSLEIMKLLMRMRKTLSEWDSDGHTPFHCAVLEVNVGTVKFLLEEEHIPVDERDINGRTALMLLIPEFPGYRVCWPLVHILLDAGADVNIQDKNNLSAYQLAVESDNYKLIDIFDSVLHHQ